jgi:nitrate reductase NapE component
MKDELFLESNYYKILFPIISFWCLIKIFQGGYEFGKWMYQILH